MWQKASHTTISGCGIMSQLKCIDNALGICNTVFMQHYSVDRYYQDYSSCSDRCIYCGEPADSRDHVLSVSKFTFKYPEGLYIVPCCSSCNSLAGSRFFINVRDKQDFIRNAIRKRSQWLRETKETRRLSWFESLLPKVERRLQWPSVTSVEETSLRLAHGKSFVPRPAVTPFIRGGRARRDELILPEFDDLGWTSERYGYSTPGT